MTRYYEELWSMPMTLFKDNRDKVTKAVLSNLQESLKFEAGSLQLLLEGGKDKDLYNTDVEDVFRQESYFQYLFGVKEPGCWGILNIDVKSSTSRSVLFVPRSTWRGKLLTAEVRAKYEVDEVYFADELEAFLERTAPKLILTLSATNSDSGLTMRPPEFAGKEKYVVNCDALYPIILECRVIKSAEEIEVLRYVAKGASDAHIKAMQFIRPGRSKIEGESVCMYHARKVGACVHASYTCICDSGTNSEILHYGDARTPNDRPFQDGELCLFDMGANCCGYAANITSTFPANGKFTEDQKFIYNAVLDARNAVMNTARDGVSWVDMHRLAGRVLLERLKAGGMLNGDVDEMLEAGLAGVFQPHGLGHLLGLSEEWLSKLRFARGHVCDH